MINAWSLAWEALNGTMDETYPIREDVPQPLWGKPIPIDDKTGLWKEPQPYPYENDGLDYEVDLSTIDDQYAHHFAPIEKEMAHYFKYHEKEILKDIEAVSYTHLRAHET